MTDHVFEPCNEQQRLFMESTHSEILLSGAVGAAKTRSLCEKGYMLNLLYPGNKGLIVRKEFSTLRSTTLHTLLAQVIPASHIVEHNRAEHRIVHKTGVFDTAGKEILSEIWYFGLDKGASQDYPTKILSTEFGWIAADETVELEEHDWDVLKTRLRHTISYFTKEQNDKIPRQIFGATNPDGPNHWLYKRFFLDETDNRLAILTTPYDNPYLPKSYIHELEQSLTGLTRERLLYGKWVQAEGIIYKTFDPIKHVIDDNVPAEEGGFLPLHEYKYFIVGADSNFPVQRAAVIIGCTSDGRRHVIDEFYRTNAYVQDLKEWLIEWKSRLKMYTLKVYHDPSDAEAIKILPSPGISVFRAVNAVVPGISSVDYYITNNHFRVHKRCRGLISEFQMYKWRKGTEDSIAPEPDKSTPNHALDALRYALHSDKMGVYGGNVVIVGGPARNAKPAVSVYPRW